MRLFNNNDDYIHKKWYLLVVYRTHYCDDSATIAVISKVENQIKLCIKF